MSKSAITSNYALAGSTRKGLEFAILFSELQTEVHETAKAKGWWDTADWQKRIDEYFTARLDSPFTPEEVDEMRKASQRSDGEAIALMHSELSEALEALRKGNPTDAKCPDFSQLETELADTIIRIMDFAGRKDLDIAGAILAKVAFNKTRPHKHGKKF